MDHRVIIVDLNLEAYFNSYLDNRDHIHHALLDSSCKSYRENSN